MLRILCLVATLASVAAAEVRQTAFQAYGVVPHDAALRLARIDACEGSPQPERWHFIVHDPQAENGLRDYVIARGQVASTNGASQFAEEEHVEDVLALNSVRIDSAYIAQVATAYAAANSERIASLNYDLHRDSLAARARWTVTCLDSSSRPFGWIAIDASNGQVVGQSGFEHMPATVGNFSGEPTASDQNLGVPVGGFHQADTPPPADENTPPPVTRPREIEVRRAEPVEQEPPPQRHRIVIDPFRPIRRLFPF